MGILDGIPYHVSHLINQTESRLQFDWKHISEKKKVVTRTPPLPGITVAKERRNIKINTLSLNMLMLVRLPGDALIHYQNHSS